MQMHYHHHSHIRIHFAVGYLIQHWMLDGILPNSRLILNNNNIVVEKKDEER